MGEKTKKGKNGIIKLIFSRIFLFVLLILLQVLVFAMLILNVNENFQIVYKIINVLSLFVVVYIISERDTDPTMKLIWAVLIMAIPIFGTLLY